LPKVLSFSCASEDEGCKDDEADDAVASSMQSDAAGRRHSQHETEKTFGNRSKVVLESLTR
jgi:hypothetical protein